MKMKKLLYHSIILKHVQINRQLLIRIIISLCITQMFSFSLNYWTIHQLYKYFSFHLSNISIYIISHGSLCGTIFCMLLKEVIKGAYDNVFFMMITKKRFLWWQLKIICWLWNLYGIMHNNLYNLWG